MSIRTELSQWTDKTFGKTYYKDFFHINEIGEIDKEGNLILRIVMELKKDQGWKKSWTDDETLERWKAELLEIIGENILKIEIKSAEANENKFLGGLTRENDTEKFNSISGRIFGYRFKLEIMKRVPKGNVK